MGGQLGGFSVDKGPDGVDRTSSTRGRGSD